MFLVTRVSFFALMVLIQLLVPWLHAHTGRETAGGWHLPGLETLTPIEIGDSTVHSAPDRRDVIVSVEAGVTHRAGEIQPPQDRSDPIAEPQPAVAYPVLSPALWADHALVAPVRRTPPFHGQPRAPPYTAQRC